MNPGEMPFTGHLEELRKRVSYSLIGIVLATIATYTFSEIIFSFLTEPLREGFSTGEIIGTGPAEAFIVKLKASFILGAIASCPITFFQVWQFVSPGLMNNEKHLAMPFVFFTSLFFLSGALFCFYQVLPLGLEFFQDQYSSIGINPSIKIGEYLSFVTTLVLVFGMIFELPVLCFFLAKLRLIDHKKMIKHSRIVIVATFVIAALLTPPDPFSQILLAVPLIILYTISIGVVYFTREK